MALCVPISIILFLAHKLSTMTGHHIVMSLNLYNNNIMLMEIICLFLIPQNHLVGLPGNYFAMSWWILKHKEYKDS